MMLDISMLNSFQSLADKLKSESAGRRVIYLPNPGNYGDGLIRYGTKQFLSDFGINHQEINLGYNRIKYQLAPLLLKKDRYFFIYGGGGAWCEAYSFGRDICRVISRFTDKFAVLPSTYALPDLPDRGLMYRRDESQSKSINPLSEFCHDMAFYVSCRERQAAPEYPAPAEAVGVFMRTDRESKFSPDQQPPGNVDLSLEGDHMSNGDDFIRRVAAYETIYTDRLHVCVAACIAGRKVKLVTGNYFKIKSIYDVSIKPYFGNQVELLGEDFSPGELFLELRDL